MIAHQVLQSSTTPALQAIVWAHDQHEFILQYWEGFEVAIYRFESSTRNLHFDPVPRGENVQTHLERFRPLSLDAALDIPG